MKNPFARKKPKKDRDMSLYWEFRIAKTLGLPRLRLSRFRKNSLQEGAHWLRHDGEIVFTEPGLEAVKRWAAAPSMMVDAGVGEVKKIRVVKIPLNPRLVLGEIVDGPPGRVTAWVRNNENFREGMVFDARKSDDGIWQLQGRLPRRAGRW